MAGTMYNVRREREGRPASRREEGVPPTELSPLSEAIDAEALDVLFPFASSPDDRNLRVRFRYEGYAVTVADGGDVTVSVADD